MTINPPVYCDWCGGGPLDERAKEIKCEDCLKRFCSEECLMNHEGCPS